MRVLQINSVCGVGSTGRIANDIHTTLIEKGHDSYIAYGRNLPKDCKNAIRIGNKIDNFTHVAKTRLLDKHGLGSKQATIELIIKIKDLNPDIIHLHNLHGYYINVEVLFNYLKEVNKPIVWTLHDCWSFTGHCAYFDYVDCDKWKSGCYNCPQKKAYPSSLIVDNSKHNFEAKKEIFNGVKNLTIVTPSEWLANLLLESFLNEYPVRVINNGIDLKLFNPSESSFRAKYNLQDNFIILGVASTWDHRKGLKYFVEMTKLLKKNEKIVLVGLSKKELKEIPSNILGISRTNEVEELAEIYSSADVFVNPTLEDNFPTTNLEALACGTPVITFDTGGSSESIDDKTGIIVEGKSLAELYKSISMIKANSKSQYRDECINRAINYFDKNDRYIDYILLYEDLLVSTQ